MEKPSFWNHNAAYYPWVRRWLDRKGARMVLDVGCGEGSLARYLAAPGRKVLGLDPSADVIAAAQAKTGEGDKLRFLCTAFEDYEAPPGSLDAVVFAASLHHMEERRVIGKAKELLKTGGVLLIVGLASPSGSADWALEALRVLPAGLGTWLHRARSSEELGLSVSYELPKMAEVRDLMRQELPGAKLRSGLYYRYLLRWTKP